MWVAIGLTAENRRMWYIPEELAPGFQTLEDNTEVFSQRSACYYPECARRVLKKIVFFIPGL
jgi:dTDP-4-dehydrorhamnose 3,5-epimerase